MNKLETSRRAGRWRWGSVGVGREPSGIQGAKWAYRLSVVVFLICVGGCNMQVYRMSVPPALEAESRRFDVHGWIGPFSHKVRFGPYVADPTSLGWRHNSMSGPTLSNGEREVTEARQSGRFRMVTTNAGRIDASCHMQRRTRFTSAQEFKLIGLRFVDKVELAEQRETYRCRFEREAAPSFELSVELGGEGRATVDGKDIALEVVSHYNSAPIPTAEAREGYLIKEDGRHVAAVDFTSRSSVTLRNDLAPQRRDEVAAIALGLLMLGKMP